ncbi:hypothetical protein EUGRSUZ_D00277 [Eucalyptus grandis]|uniref:Uncharacterized protein n=2 Tax=Eucalyptus grandis TaxID=71139 RepID=A0ACC3L2S4_EUCGR|nr:hypothetical protein EUGRSUZ_D00277 [Eucalyptus grandis]
MMAYFPVSRQGLVVLEKPSSVRIPSYVSLLYLRCYCSVQLEEEKVEPQDKSSKRAKTRIVHVISQLINRSKWSDKLESSLSPLAASLSKTNVLRTLQLIKSPARALLFFKWIQGKMGFVHDHQSYFFMLEMLGRCRNLNAARNFLFSIERMSNGAVKLEDRYFNSLIRSYGKAGLFQESLKLFEKMKEIGISPSVITFNNLFSLLLKRGRTNMVKHVYDEMLNTYGVTPDTYTYNILIRGFCMNSMVDEGFHFFKEMSQFNCEPDVITYNTLVDGLCRAGKVNIANNVVKGMRTKSADLKPNVITYTTLIRGYCMKGEIDDALAIIEEMVNGGLKPNKITYNTLIKGLCEARKLDKIKEILEGTVGKGDRVFIPDSCTLNTLMHSHCNSGNLDEALNVFEKMSELQVSPDSASYSVLIRSLCQKGEFERAEVLFNELSEKQILLSDAGCVPLVAAYHPMFVYLCKSGKTKKAEEVFRQLMKRGMQDPPSYKTLIVGHCREGTFEAGYDLLVLMLRRDFVPDYETYLSLIEGLLSKDNPLLAYKILEKMLRSSHHPRSSTFHAILTVLLKKERAHESASLVKVMLEKHIRQNINLSTQTVRLLFSRGLGRKAFELVNLLYQNGYVIAIEELTSFLCQKGKVLEAGELLLYGLRKDSRIDINMYSIVMKGLCERRQLSQAFALFYELVERESFQNLDCCEELRTALVADGRHAEANFVAKRMPSNLCDRHHKKKSLDKGVSGSLPCRMPVVLPRTLGSPEEMG